MDTWRLDDSIFKQRKRWADSKSFYDTDPVLRRMFDLDWRRAITREIGSCKKGDNDKALEEFELHNCQAVLAHHVKLIYSAFFYYAAAEAWRSEPMSNVPIDTSVFTYDPFMTFAFQTELVDQNNVTKSVIAEVFDWAQADEYGLDVGVDQKTHAKPRGRESFKSETAHQSSIASLGVMYIARGIRTPDARHNEAGVPDSLERRYQQGCSQEEGQPFSRVKLGWTRRVARRATAQRI